MMDLSTLEHVNRQATRRAAAAKRVPLIIEQADIDAAKRGDLSGIRVPYVGGRTPRGWRRVDVRDWPSRAIYDCEGKGLFFVDKSGMGQRGEPALTIDEFVELLRPGYGYAVVEEGPFQVHVGVFEPTTRKGEVSK